MYFLAGAGEERIKRVREIGQPLTDHTAGRIPTKKFGLLVASVARTFNISGFGYIFRVMQCES